MIGASKGADRTRSGFAFIHICEKNNVDSQMSAQLTIDCRLSRLTTGKPRASFA